MNYKLQTDSIQQSQQEFEYMARLQQERARNRQNDEPVQFDSADNAEDNDINPEDFEEARINPPSAPSFPMFIFALALIKDFLADPAELTIVGIIASWIATILFAVIVLFWCIGKAGFMKKFIIKRLALIVAFGLLPILNFLPEASMFVAWMHYREVKYIGSILQALEKLEGSK